MWQEHEKFRTNETKLIKATERSFWYLFVLVPWGLSQEALQHWELQFKKKSEGTPVAVQWLRLQASKADGSGSVSGQVTMTLHAMWQNNNTQQ